MKYSKLSKTSKCIIASTLLTGATIATIVPIVLNTSTATTTSITATNDVQKIETGITNFAFAPTLTNPPVVFAKLPSGISEATNFYDLTTFADGTVKNRYLLGKYIDLSSIPEFVTVGNVNIPNQLLMTPNSIPSDIHKLDFTFATSAIYDANGIAINQIKTYSFTIDLPYINWGLILGLSIPGGLLLIGAIIFSVWYYKRTH